MLKDMQDKCSSILESFDLLRIILKDRAIYIEDSIMIFDQVEEKPLIIKISKKNEKIQFFCNEEEIALITSNSFAIEEGYEGVVKEWLDALTSLGFKRYIPKF